MPDAINATEKAAFDRLDAQITGAGVYQHAPNNAAPPVVIIGDIDASPIGAKDDPDRRIAMIVVVVTEGQQRKPCSDLVAQVEQAIDGVTMTVDGYSIELTVESSQVVLSGDAETYVGTVNFTGFALAA
ncbi:DUF3168 domain-containing protein [Sphingomonas sp. SFZ2018-12]|uniref:tail completion protein gp17 n=1 Tax=Sphingomonas sp. SFZ2018-12 TaxID=2683197 RepID=UPI001F0E35F0|nr:DUF3168 domain-containing protein [Sphingomonas sp. SFZ2018-12]MCH4894006.1 DUF3168 domain-containing protein [Sphingomonas sp. SFZ2018-12]